MRFKQFFETATVAQFADDFEQVLNLVVGGNWTLSNKDWIDSFDASSGRPVVMGLGAQYRGMSENGRHYDVEISLLDDKHSERDSSSLNYDFKQGDPDIKFSLGNMVELGGNFSAYGKSHASLGYVHVAKDSEFFNAPVQLAQKIKQILSDYERRNDVPQPNR